MNIIEMIYCFILGSCIASFVNVVIYRLPRKLNFMSGRSFCPKCHHQLAWFDLIPLISWVMLKGRCRYCQERISIRYFIIEFIGGIFAILSFYVYGHSLMSLLFFMICMCLMTISVIDFDTMMIDDRLILFYLICSCLTSFFIQYSFIERVVGLIIMSIPMLLLNMIKESFGGADIKLIAVSGILLGGENVVIVMMLAVILASLVCLYLILLKKRSMKSYIPFAPFISFAVIVVFLFQNEILNFYLSLFYYQF